MSGSRVYLRVNRTDPDVCAAAAAITMTDLYEFDHTAGVDENGKVLGLLKPTGLRPSFIPILAERGIKVGHGGEAEYEQAMAPSESRRRHR